jgi:hypothetical protein
VTITNGYCTLNDVKNQLSIDEADVTDDALIESVINAASRQIDRYCGQRFWLDPSVVTRQFYVDDYGVDLDLAQDDVIGIGDTTGLIVKADTAGTGSYATTLASGTDFLLAPSNAAITSPAAPYTSLTLGLSGATTYAFPRSYGRPAAQITATWGWPAIPDDVALACALQAMQLFKSKDAVFGVASFGEFGPLRVRSALNPIAEGLIAPYARPAVG